MKFHLQPTTWRLYRWREKPALNPLALTNATRRHPGGDRQCVCVIDGMVDAFCFPSNFPFTSALPAPIASVRPNLIKSFNQTADFSKDQNRLLRSGSEYSALPEVLLSPDYPRSLSRSPHQYTHSCEIAISLEGAYAGREFSFSTNSVPCCSSRPTMRRCSRSLPTMCLSTIDQEPSGSRKRK